jgi:hypothetical protein
MKALTSLALLIFSLFFAILNHASPVPPVAWPGHGGDGIKEKRILPVAWPGHGGEGASKRSEMDHSALIARGGGGAAHDKDKRCAKELKCRLNAKAYYDTTTKSCQCPTSPILGKTHPWTSCELD